MVNLFLNVCNYETLLCKNSHVDDNKRKLLILYSHKLLKQIDDFVFLLNLKNYQKLFVCMFFVLQQDYQDPGSVDDWQNWFFDCSIHNQHLCNVLKQNGQIEDKYYFHFHKVYERIYELFYIKEHRFQYHSVLMEMHPNHLNDELQKVLQLSQLKRSESSIFYKLLESKEHEFLVLLLKLSFSQDHV